MSHLADYLHPILKEAQMSNPQPAAEFTARDVLQQIDHRLSLIETDVRENNAKIDDLKDEVIGKFDDLEAKTARLSSTVLRLKPRPKSTILRLKLRLGSMILRPKPRLSSTVLRPKPRPKSTVLRLKLRPKSTVLRPKSTVLRLKLRPKSTVLRPKSNLKYANYAASSTANLLGYRPSAHHLAVDDGYSPLQIVDTVTRPAAPTCPISPQAQNPRCFAQRIHLADAASPATHLVELDCCRKGFVSPSFCRIFCRLRK